MSKIKELTGACLCGGVKVQIQNAETQFDVCHCGMCRKWGGGPNFTMNDGDEFKILGEELVIVFSSSDWAERGFCKQCGTHLFYRLKGKKLQNFSLGLFPETENFKFNSQIFIDSKPPCYDFANTTQKLTEAETIAKFS